MPVTFSAAFEAKHLHVPVQLPGSSSAMGEAQMKDEALTVFRARNGHNTAQKVALLGRIQPTSSTLVVLTVSEKERILADANANFQQVGQHSISISGAIITPKGSSMLGSLFTEEDIEYSNFGVLTYSTVAVGANFEINHFVSFVPNVTFTVVRVSRSGFSFQVDLKDP